MIDWRRSASSDTLFVREREWEASHTFWLWPDVSPSMAFRSHLSQIEKRDRALVLTLAVAEMLVRAGERVALLGLTPPLASRKATTRIAEALAVNEGTEALQASLPPKARLSRFSSAILVGDFLDPPEAIAQRLNEMAEGGVQGHLMQVLDPAEETLAYRAAWSSARPKARERWVADRVETLRGAYQQKLAAHRAADRGGGAPPRLVVPRPPHRPPRRGAAAHADHAPAGHVRRLSLEARSPSLQRLQSLSAKPRETPDDARSDRLPEPLCCWPASWPSAHLVAPARRPAAPAAHRLSADAHPGGHREPGEDARQDALVAHPHPHGRRGAGDPGAGGARC